MLYCAVHNTPRKNIADGGVGWLGGSSINMLDVLYWYLFEWKCMWYLRQPHPTLHMLETLNLYCIEVLINMAIAHLYHIVPFLYKQYMYVIIAHWSLPDFVIHTRGHGSRETSFSQYNSASVNS